MKNRRLGPATLIAAAFIGPGTVTVCLIAGVEHKFELLWALVFSILATITLQEMAARVSVVTHQRLSKIILSSIPNTVLRTLMAGVIISAIVIGNTAFEAGNISGAVLGIQAINDSFYSSIPSFTFPVIVGALVIGLLFIGTYNKIEKWLIGLVGLLSICFVLAAFMTGPSLIEIVKGMICPKIPPRSILKIIGLIGTTVVPYNLFLHSALIQEKWKGKISLSEVRFDLYTSVLIGGIVSMMIIITGAALHSSSGPVSNVSEMVQTLEGTFGSMAKYVLGIGLFAAGLTSSITAPMAAAFVTTQILGYKVDLSGRAFRSVAVVVVLLGVIISSLGIKPMTIIVFAQFMNGLLLPLVAGILLWVINKRNVMKTHRNNKLQNILGLLIFIVALGLGLKSMLKIIEGLFL